MPSLQILIGSCCFDIRIRRDSKEGEGVGSLCKELSFGTTSFKWLELRVFVRLEPRVLEWLELRVFTSLELRVLRGLSDILLL